MPKLVINARFNTKKLDLGLLISTQGVSSGVKGTPSNRYPQHKQTCFSTSSFILILSNCFVIGSDWIVFRSNLWNREIRLCILPSKATDSGVDGPGNVTSGVSVPKKEFWDPILSRIWRIAMGSDIAQRRIDWIEGPIAIRGEEGRCAPFYVASNYMELYWQEAKLCEWRENDPFWT